MSYPFFSDFNDVILSPRRFLPPLLFFSSTLDEPCASGVVARGRWRVSICLMKVVSIAFLLSLALFPPQNQDFKTLLFFFCEGCSLPPHLCDAPSCPHDFEMFPAPMLPCRGGYSFFLVVSLTFLRQRAFVSLFFTFLPSPVAQFFAFNTATPWGKPAFLPSTFANYWFACPLVIWFFFSNV